MELSHWGQSKSTGLPSSVTIMLYSLRSPWTTPREKALATLSTISLMTPSGSSRGGTSESSVPLTYPVTTTCLFQSMGLGTDTPPGCRILRASYSLLAASLDW